MTPPETLADRSAHGRSARKNTPRSAHAAIGNVDRDPVRLLRESSHGRVSTLVPLRYGRMLASPFTFFRGSAIIQAHDLAATANSGFHFQICGDCHLMNFGGFATPERSLVFDINDFDETAIGPWEWDLKRLTASLYIAVRHLGHGDRLADDVVAEAVMSYQHWTAEYSQMSPLELWCELITFARLEELSPTADARSRIRDGISRASRRTHETILPKLASRREGIWQIRDAPPTVFHVHGKNTLFTHDDDWLGLGDWRTLMQPLYDSYLRSLGTVRRTLLDHFTMHDMAFKVVGVGSVGTRCLILLMVDQHEKPLFIQFKEASTSVVSRFFKARGPKHQGQRVVDGQRLMQGASDPFLGWTTGPFGRAIYGRQLRDMKISATLELFAKETFRQYAAVCGWVLARAHAKAGGVATEIDGYLGNGEQMTEALVLYSRAYADQVEQDYERFRDACRSGRLEARTDADMAADFVA
ncbi:DUF2252 domain-containing protein [Paraburkholderia sp. MMS20-SJTR3]|uniref:DUF2252 domain-containing protein n=1 Tax=Paraburkholderia sejongensis TaxID=2886946 RepID=A0ABS8K5T9_9BURK|nr:DUF2252 domain-containing protein [Paraburkholderia sp. MMS20-SJTR3]MCC8397532.1 DUF2252 domain-containing protein [Paraburkholderia sp. MMS20-SJTR3]